MFGIMIAEGSAVSRRVSEEGFARVFNRSNHQRKAQAPDGAEAARWVRPV